VVAAPTLPNGGRLAEAEWAGAFPKGGAGGRRYGLAFAPCRSFLAGWRRGEYSRQAHRSGAALLEELFFIPFSKNFFCSIFSFFYFKI